MGPAEIETPPRDARRAVTAQASRVIVGDDLLDAQLSADPRGRPRGRAARAPRLIEITWGEPAAPKVTLVGKGVCFDTGGLDIKPDSGMLLMKKDMGGAATRAGARPHDHGRGPAGAAARADSGGRERDLRRRHSGRGDVYPRAQGPARSRSATPTPRAGSILADALALADEEQPGAARSTWPR